MALIALASVSGSPGVTTTALGLALAWPRPVLLVEADPTGGSGILPGYLRGTREYDGGLLELALTAESLPDALAQVARPIENTSVSYVAGTRSHTQAGALREIWQPLGEVLRDLESTGQDVIVDAGRLGMVGSPDPLLSEADLTLLLTRTTLPALSAVRSWADALHRGVLGWHEAGLVLVGESQPYTAKEIRSALNLRVVATITDDPEAAAVLHRGAAPSKRYDSGGFTRSLSAAGEAIRSVIGDRQAELAAGATS